MDEWNCSPYLKLLGDEQSKGRTVLPQRNGLYDVPYGPMGAITEPDMGILERMNGVRAMDALPKAAAAIAVQWLAHRNPGERNIRIDYRAESRGRGGSGAGEQLHARLEVNIW